jgi:hypothetical protein
MTTAVCILVHGTPAYHAAGAESARSVLRHTPFPLLVAHDPGERPDIPPGPRLTLGTLASSAPSRHRAHRFLRKFDAIRLALESLAFDRLLLLDADAVFVRRCGEGQVDRALGNGAMAMVEQPTVTGSSMGRSDFLAHYVEHSLALLAPGSSPPTLDSFRYFNSGVVVATRAEWAAFVEWALATRCRVGHQHSVGDHMVADQDYFQLWAHTRARTRCRELRWYWNHCEHWDAGFPRAGVLIAHFSNFCNGPADGVVERMRGLQSGPWSRWNELVGRLRDVGPREKG